MPLPVNALLADEHQAGHAPNSWVKLPRECLTPGLAFHQVGVDYVGPILIKSGAIRKPTVTKAYICVFTSFSVKTLLIKPVTELTMAAFIATLRRFVAQRGKPATIWSDHGTNFVGAARELNEIYKHLKATKMQESIANVRSQQEYSGALYPSTLHILVVCGRLP